MARPNHTVIAAVRDPAAPTATSLETLTPASGTRLILVKIDSKVDTDAAEAVRVVQAAGIQALDVVIANAGIAPPVAKLASAPLQDLREAVEVNTVAPLALFQAVVPLLQAAAAPRFLVVSTAIASIRNLEATSAFALGTYGASKAAVNYLVRRMAFENRWLNSFAMHPGCVIPLPPALLGRLRKGRAANITFSPHSASSRRTWATPVRAPWAWRKLTRRLKRAWAESPKRCDKRCRL